MRRVYHVFFDEELFVNEERNHGPYCTRGTGHLGSGFYVTLEKQEVKSPRVQKEYAWPWRNPFTIENELQLRALHTLGGVLCNNATTEGSQRLKVDDVRKRVDFEHLPASFNKANLWNTAVKLAKESPDGTQPINFLLTNLGYDGVVNPVADHNGMGSVVFHKIYPVDMVKRSGVSVSRKKSPELKTPMKPPLKR